MSGDVAYSLTSDAETVLDLTPAPEAPRSALRPCHIPHVNIHAFCEDQDTATAIEKAAKDRRLARANVAVQMGGVQAAVAFYKNAATPNLIIIEFFARPDRVLA